METHELFLLIGSNQGDREALLRQAAGQIDRRIGAVSGRSKIYRTAPWGDFGPGGPPQDFLNQALRVSTPLAPSDCLARALDIERDLGRVREARGHYASRTIDIDLILYDALVRQTEPLTLPHPRMHLRRFVLVPLCDIAPDLIHPIFNKTLSQLLCECPDTSSCSCY